MPNPVSTVRAFLAALEARDLDRAADLTGPDFQMVFPGGAGFGRLSDLVAWAADRYQRVVKSFEGFEVIPGRSPVVYCRGTLSGLWPDGTAFRGIRFVDRFELTGGLITRQDVWNDLAEHCRT